MSAKGSAGAPPPLVEGPIAGGRVPPYADDPNQPPPPGQGPIVMAALAIGLLLMGVQLWLLTVALDLYLSGGGEHAWQLALVSGLIFLGGVAMDALLSRRPRLRRPQGLEWRRLGV